MECDFKSMNDSWGLLKCYMENGSVLLLQHGEEKNIMWYCMRLCEVCTASYPELETPNNVTCRV